MFGKNQKKNGTQEEQTSNKVNSAYSGTKGTCVIVKGTIIQGEFKTSADTRVDGEIIGNIHCDARIITGPESKIEGTIHSKEAVIAGQFKGEMTISKLLTLQETANVQGNIQTKSIQVDPGAMLNGEVKVTTVAAIKDKPSVQKTEVVMEK